ncbi:MAG: hypothetical protein J4G18_18530, partial [Anaerolineae bacterium]|nr:hypothetical protein [Anaerolineae bacterium]
IRGMVVILWLPRITGDQLCGKYFYDLLAFTEGTEDTEFSGLPGAELMSTESTAPGRLTFLKTWIKAIY